MKILIADDNEADRDLLRYILEHHGCEVMEASEGAEGLRLASSKKPDLIISDALMPVMDGFHFLRALKKDEALKEIPFVFYSAVYTGSEEVGFGIELGAEAFILKPKDPDELWEELMPVVEVSRQKSETSSPAEAINDEHDYLQRYSTIVATTLEGKVRELEAANQKIRESERFINKILETVDEGIIVIGPDYKIISANRAYCLYSRQQPDDALGRYCYECSHGVDRPCFELGMDCPVKYTFATGRAGSAVHAHHIADGDTALFEVKSFPMVDDAEKVVAVVEVSVDITEKTKLEAQLQQAQKMESIGTLAGGIAHDFNNILSAIMGYGGIALMEMAEDDPQRRNIEIMLEAADRAVKLTRDLLLFSRKHVLTRRVVDLSTVVRQVEKFLLKVIGEDVECRFVLPEEPIVVNADSHQLEQVLMNYATNARDAMPKGGVFTVSVERVELREEFAAAHGSVPPGTYAVLSVTDTGEGIAAEVQQRIFEPFFTTKEVGKGTGLGLAVAYGIVKQHEGYIAVFSEPGSGTTFRVYLPIFSATVAVDGVAEKREIPVRGTETILLAEDNEPVRELLTVVLTQAGYTVIAAVDGEDAVRKFKENKERIQLLFFDYLMPKMNGKEAYDEIRGVAPDIKIIFASGYAPDVVQVETVGVSTSRLISKPVSPVELLRTVRSVLDEC